MIPRINPIPCFLGVLFLLIACGAEPRKSSAAATAADPAASSAQGPKGDTGPAGPQGPKGDAGAAGASGSAVPGLATIWFDPDTGASWQFISVKATFADAKCPDGWELPAADVPARLSAYFMTYEATLPDASFYWTSTSGTAGHIARNLNVFHSAATAKDSSDVVDSETHVVICTKAAQ